MTAGNRDGPILTSKIFGTVDLDKYLRTQSESVAVKFLKERVQADFSVFITDEGHLGIGCKFVQKGDIMSVFSRGRLPVILRPRDDHDKVLEQCYLYNLMNGEAIEQLTARKYTEK